MVLDAMGDKACLGNGWMGRWEEWHERASRGVLETGHCLPKTEKERESGGWTRTKGM